MDLDPCTHQRRACGWRYVHGTPASNVIYMRPQWPGDVWVKHPRGHSLSHRQDAEYPQRGQRLLRGQTREEWRVVSEPRRVSRLGPCCTQSFPEACGPGCGCVPVCTGHRLQGGGTIGLPERRPCSFLQEWVREGVPGSEVTSVSQSPMELGTPVTRHPHPVQPQLSSLGWSHPLVEDVLLLPSHLWGLWLPGTPGVRLVPML